MFGLRSVGTPSLAISFGGHDGPGHGAIALPPNGAGDTWVLNGVKKWIGNATWCDLIVVWGRDETDARPGARPRPRGLRHTFATQTMIDAFLAGRDPARTLTLLSVWLGHANPADTYWYLQRL